MKLLVFPALLLLSASPAHAVDFLDGRVSLNGFGGWSYGITKDNIYLSGTPLGNFSHADFALNVSGRVTDRIKVAVQASAAESEDGLRGALDYAFAEWTIGDALRIRGGMVKQPFGLSTEVFNVGTLRPFYRLPQAVYGPVGFVGLAYKGLGLTGKLDFKGWTVAYDLYGGGVDLSEYLPPETFLHGEPVSTSTEVNRERTRNVIGGRVTVETPLEGLRFGVSGYGGEEIASDGPVPRYVFGAHAEYASDRWLIRAEYVHETVVDDMIVDAVYVEPAFHITEQLQVALQGGWLTSSLPGVPDPVAPSFLSHLEGAVGVNFWVNPNLVLKVAFHHVEGNRFAGPEPEDYAVLVAEGRLKPATNLLTVTVQFAF